VSPRPVFGPLSGGVVRQGSMLCQHPLEGLAPAVLRVDVEGIEVGGLHHDCKAAPAGPNPFPQAVVKVTLVAPVPHEAKRALLFFPFVVRPDLHVERQRRHAKPVQLMGGRHAPVASGSWNCPCSRGGGVGCCGHVLNSWGGRRVLGRIGDGGRRGSIGMIGLRRVQDWRGQL
jgi:hypothetical protein